MGRSLPGILESGMWKALGPPLPSGEELVVRAARAAEFQADHNALPAHALTPALFQRERESTRSFALITDIGNDIMYGASPESITQWVDQCIDRLESHGARVAINSPPIDSLRSVKRWQYSIVRALLFPTRRLTFEQAIGRAIELHDRVIDLTRRRNLTLIECERHWYGFDPIHIRQRHWQSAWGKIMGGCVGTSNAAASSRPMSLAERAHLLTRSPAEWRILGIRRGRAQPCGRLNDGTRISLF